MNQTWENSKKPSFESDFGLFGTNLAHQLLFFFFCFFFFSKIWLRQSLDLMVRMLSTNIERPMLNLLIKAKFPKIYL